MSGCGPGKRQHYICFSDEEWRMIQRAAKRYGLSTNQLIVTAVRLLLLRREDPFVVRLVAMRGVEA